MVIHSAACYIQLTLFCSLARAWPIMLLCVSQSELPTTFNTTVVKLEAPLNSEGHLRAEYDSLRVLFLLTLNVSCVVCFSFRFSNIGYCEDISPSMTSEYSERSAWWDQIKPSVNPYHLNVLYIFEWMPSLTMKYNLQSVCVFIWPCLSFTVPWDSQPIKQVLLSSASDVIWRNILQGLCARHQS